ncbi:hypothetical protein [Jannaschia sp. M317]|uniref:hypothetical protein n=1 Tax=Jannaschia sp. M317 TaxID=2867011 RepID=UPI0021A4A658|nr:hypothetical protein [Jannaschia sp. M317]UWQ16627.1 hypothetical protein K3551_11970 [Jannaschia sp. M317]
MTIDRMARGLKISAAIIMGFGLTTFLAATNPTLAMPSLWFVDLMTPPVAGAEGLTTPEGRLVLAILGGITFGWGVTTWQLAGAPLRATPEPIRKIVLTGFLAWFCLDSLGSVLAGAPWNVVPNIGFLALIAWPVARPVAVADAISV